ncbi:TPA: flagellar biosynthetic protein FliR [Candidatus Poribacteria bacterium]|nr:flagellar biosynthetic protein FliR [Candidatus Poribacteria bacterium]
MQGEIINLTSGQIISFMLVFFRIGAILFTAPLFGGRNIPVQVRILLSLALAIVITTVVVPYKGIQAYTLDQINNVWVLFMSIAKEIIVGIAIGFIAQLTFTGIQIAGQLIGNDIGFGMMNIFDPSSHDVVTITAGLYSIVAGLIFLVTNSYQYVLMAIARSFDAIPLGHWFPSESYVWHLSNVFNGIFGTGLKIAIPVMGALFLTKIAMAIITRTMPQMNVFVVGFPLQIAIGLLAMAFSLPFVSQVIRNLFIGMRDNIWIIFR